MAKIAVLDKQTIDQIAAGEVVERPASVVKELVENAIDAGSAAITVEIKQGGISFIRITDNGCGIERSEIKKAFLRHATSKITSVSDLLTIASLGFRGEALSSIAAVAQVELITKEKEELTGIRFVINGGTEESFEEIGAPDGTTIIVRNLFYNVPARAKFLKTATTEGNYISSYMEQLALSHPKVSFKYILNGQIRFQTTGHGDVKEIIYQIYGRDIAKELLPLSYNDENVYISGYIGKPIISRGNRNFENYYVNGRYVKDKILMKAIEEGYRTFMMQHQYPFTCLFFELPGSDVDINVHPAKMEVRFSDQEDIYFRTKEAIIDVLHKNELIYNAEESEKKEDKKPLPKKEALPEPFETKRREALFLKNRPVENVLKEKPAPYKAKEQASLQPEKTAVSVTIPSEGAITKESAPAKETVPEKTTAPRQMNLFEDTASFPLADKSRFTIIGQLFNTYWLFEMEDCFYIMDQHAAHEKVNYEAFMKAHEQREILPQMISPPIVVHPSMQEMELIDRYSDVFTEFGFETEPFGEGAIAIRAVPYNLYGIASQDVFKELLAGCAEGLEKNDSRELIGHRIATMACKAAIKGNNRLSVAEVEVLLEKLLTLDNPYQCPHGRPTIIRMTKAEIEKKFRRIV